MKYRALNLCLAAAFFAVAPAMAGEYAILKTGLRLRTDRHEISGDMVRLYSGQGFVELSAAQVASFEAEDYVPPPPAPTVALAAAPVSAPAKPARSPKELLDQAALRHGLPPGFVRSVAAIESGFHQEAVSPKGAIGLMQLMPKTAEALQKDPRDPEQNADGGAQYLRDLLVKYDFSASRALAAYNAGPAAVDRYNGVPPYPETRQYVNRVIREYEKAGDP
jgi:soluble lytic murein transglycosylase-like protein